MACGQSAWRSAHVVVELRGRDREDAGVAAHLVERGQPRPAVEGAVLDALGHHHAAGLLEAPRRPGVRVGQHRHQRVERPAQVRAVLQRQRDRLVEVLATLGQVGPVDGEAGQQLGDGVGHRRVPVGGDRGGAGAPCCISGCRSTSRVIRLTSECRMPSATSRLVSWIIACQSTGTPRSLASSASSGCLPGRVGQHPVDVGQRVVPRGAGGGPAAGQLLARLQDLLDEHVGVPGQLGEVVEVAPRVAQAVGVVDPQPVDQALGEPAPDLDVRVGEHLGVLDAHRRQRVHREEAAVVQAVVGDAPVDQLVVLAPVHGVRVDDRAAGVPSTGRPRSSAVPGAIG